MKSGLELKIDARLLPRNHDFGTVRIELEDILYFKHDSIQRMRVAAKSRTVT